MFTPRGSYTPLILVFSPSSNIFSLLAGVKQVAETILEPDERGWVDRRSLFRFLKCTLPSAPDRALERVLDDLTETLEMEGESSQEKSGHIMKGRNTGSSGHNNSKVLIGTFLERGDFIDRLTLHM